MKKWLAPEDLWLPSLAARHARHRLSAHMASVSEKSAGRSGKLSQDLRRLPDPYWRDIDKASAYPQAFRRCADGERLSRRADPGSVWRRRSRHHRGRHHPGRDQPLGRQRARLSRPDVHDGHAAASTAAKSRSGRYLPKIAAGELRLSGLRRHRAERRLRDRPRSRLRAVRQGDKYIVNGQKIFISRVKQSDLMLLLARTTPYDELKDKTEGLSVFLVDLREHQGQARRQAARYDDQPPHQHALLRECRVPAENLVGEEGKGFRHIIDGWNAERILIAVRGDRRRPLVRRAGREICERARRLRQARSAPIRACSFRSPAPTAHVEAADRMRFDGR